MEKSSNVPDVLRRDGNGDTGGNHLNTGRNELIPTMRTATLVVCLQWSTSLVGCGGPADQQPSTQVVPPGSGSSQATASIDATNSKPDVAEDSAIGEPKNRKFTFRYRFRVHGLTTLVNAEKDETVRVWMPCPSSSDSQDITRRDATTPGKILENVEPRYGNRILYFETPVPPSGEFTVDVPYQVVRREVRSGISHSLETSPESLDDDRRERFLGADRMVPTTGKPLKLLDSVKLRERKIDVARQLYELVDDHVTYKKEGTGWGRGDSNWVCDSGYGNCTDFHSLFISLARSQKIPARFEIGFSIPTNTSSGPITGYHCWAWFHLEDRGWIPVDISEADKHPELKEYYFGNLTADRLMFSMGRDLTLVPESDQEPLNFFVYPHIEVAGGILPAENVDFQFMFSDER